MPHAKLRTYQSPPCIEHAEHAANQNHMEAEQLTLLIDRLEVYSREHPTAYRFKVAALAGLGYAYLLAVVLLLLLVVYFVLSLNFSYVTIKIVWIPLVLVDWCFVRSGDHARA